MRKLFLSRMEGDNIDGHLEDMAKIFEHLNSLTNPERPLTQDNFYTTAILTSLSQESLPCVSALMNEPYVASSKVISALQQEGLRQKARAEDILTAPSAASAKTKPQCAPKPQDNTIKRCKFCNVDGHDLNNYFNTARILRDDKSRRPQGTNLSLPNKRGERRLNQRPRPVARPLHISAGPLNRTRKSPTIPAPR
jgi:hypothetical protein